MLGAFRAAPVDHLLDSSGCSEALSDGLVKNSLFLTLSWFQLVSRIQIQSFTNHQKTRFNSVLVMMMMMRWNLEELSAPIPEDSPLWSLGSL